MKLENLTQLALLDKGQPDLVHNAVQQLHQELLHREITASQRVAAMEALSLKPLTSVMLKLLTLCKRDDRRKKGKPQELKLQYDELTAVRCMYARLLATAHDPGHHDQLATALARLHQPSLTLERFVKLPPATGPGSQCILPV